MLFLFAFTLFVSASLLFLVQPMIGKLILPRLGGTPGVWNTCMVFFQAVLLIGYAYTHAVSTWKRRSQVLLQCAILALPFLVLPFSLGQWRPPVESNPVLPLLILLLGVVGLPFFVVATSAPLLQKWFSGTDHPAAQDPYFLYGASNFGSMLALLAYPVLVEPLFDLPEQSVLWTAGYGALALFVIACGLVVWKAPSGTLAAIATKPLAAVPAAPTPTAIVAERRTLRQRTFQTRTATPPPALTKEKSAPDEINTRRRLRWVGLAAAPSSLMLGVTTYLTTDIAAIPFFWVVPLALYLLTFILVFARWPVVWTGWPHQAMLFIQPVFLMFLALAMLGGLTIPTYLLFLMHVLAFFTTALVCHGELALDRPTSRHLTEFYLWMSVGGVLGGVFNALLAPLVFWTGVVEYPLAMVIACVLRPSLVGVKPLVPGDSSDERSTMLGKVFTGVVPLAIGLFAFWAAWFSRDKYLRDVIPFMQVGFYLRPFLLAVPIVLVLGLAGRPVRFGLAVALLFLGVSLEERNRLDRIYEGRSFFGFVMVKRAVEEHDEGNFKYNVLVHGGIDHGRQNLQHPRRPISYFHPTGGVGQVFTKFSWPDERLPASLVGLGNVPWGVLTAFNGQGANSEPPFAVVGLGTGTLAAFARPWQHVFFYEIDPQVKRLSLPPPGQEPVFSFLQDALDRNTNLEVILGDGRLSLKKAPEKYLHVLVLDAFSSDAIPVHLLTAEAIDLYLSKLADGGVLIFNTTNRYVDINPVLADLAASRNLEWRYFGDHGKDEHGNWVPEKFGSDWIVMRRPGPASNGGPPLAERLGDRWQRPRGLGGPIWTDSYSNLLRVLSW